MNIPATDFTFLSPQSKLNISSPFSNPQNQSSTAKQSEAENNDETRVQGARKQLGKEHDEDGNDIFVAGKEIDDDRSDYDKTPLQGAGHDEDMMMMMTMMVMIMLLRIVNNNEDCDETPVQGGRGRPRGELSRDRRP